MMNDKKVAEILEGMLTKHDFARDEREAVLAAITFFRWAVSAGEKARARIRARKEERERSEEWGMRKRD